MRAPLKALLAALVGGLLAGVPVAPALVAAAETVEVGTAEEAWYLRDREPLTNAPGGDPTCNSPAGCNGAGNVTRPKVYPDNTLHVSVNAGRPDTQTYFTFDLFSLPVDAVVTGGTVTLPVSDDDHRGGNYRADTADMVACFVTGFVVSAEGESFETRPEFDADACVPVTKVEAAEKLTYTFDLAPFGERWSAGEPNNGVTVLPNPEITAGDPAATWGVTFNGSRREGQNLRFITSRLQVQVPETGGGGAFDDVGSGPVSAASGGGGFADSGSGDSGGFSDEGFASADGGFASADEGFASTEESSGFPAEQAVAAEPETAEPALGDSAAEPLAPHVAPPAQPDAVPATTGGMPALWLLPLLGLSLAGLLGYSLSQPVELPPQREGAVSKLMRARRETA